ncbi:1,4-alpha-glucan branching protein GlgB [uncultured Ruminococcus sp.]|uniref:1,4-alpha-glucan branching protein GlgB n=1 Tax=uncultured Ruminococcus sp. TaxID=165186 RepID=UPI00266C05CC|nr:1,4-alpha-glucan branching protein GlgB [uncultured Ruminococcus sp.]
MDIHQFFLGNSFDAHTYFGAHITRDGVVFRTLAPNAKAVALIWEGGEWEPMPMTRIHDGGVYEITVPDALPGQMYKYRITPQNPDGETIDHCDPYGFGMELRPNNASIIRDLSSYTFHDRSWMKQRSDHRHKPVNIYEVHLGSWMTNPHDENGWYTYEEIAPKLVKYVRENGYNYIEFMPLSEHPADCSWGYQNTGFFSPTARYGTAHQLMQLVDTCHQAGIGVIIDFVPVHFAVDGYALNHYDGTTLYEYPEKEDTYSEWGSCNFIHARGEVCSFLQSNAFYWLDVFHFDGIRMDAVSRLIYWGGEEYRGTNPSSIQFLKRMNQGLHQRYPDAMLIAEDSTNYSGVTKPVEYGGLGFDYKWDMGWMNDTLNYFRQYPWERKNEYHKLTFSMMYFPNEYYLLPLSHDENVHGKATILQKMFGQYEQKFPQARALYLYMYAHPGKKLLFMGSELGQLREWTETQQQDFDILKFPIHDAFHHFMMELNRLYLTEPALYEGDYEADGFRWLDCHQEERCIYAIQRHAAHGEDLVILLHFSDEGTQHYTFTLPDCTALQPLLHTDWERFHGNTVEDTKPIVGEMTRNGCQFQIDLPPFSGILLKKIPQQKKPAAKPKKSAGTGTKKK